MITNEDVANALSQMSIPQIVSIYKELETKWGVRAEPQAIETTQIKTQDTKPEVKTEFNVILLSYPNDKKIAVIKAVREITGLDLKSSKEMCETAPKVIKEMVSDMEADRVKQILIDAGAVVEVK